MWSKLTTMLYFQTGELTNVQTEDWQKRVVTSWKTEIYNGIQFQQRMKSMCSIIHQNV